VIDGLTIGATYNFRVRAVNRLGSSLESVVSAPVLIGTRPSAPTNVTALRGNREIEVRWTAAVAPDLPVTSYSASAVEDPSKNCTVPVASGATAATSCVVDGLINGVSYSFIVRASNAVGVSDASEATSPLVPGAVPDTVDAPDVVAGALQATIAWETPADNGVAIDSYVVESVDDPTLTCTYEVPTSGESLDECTITGLTADSSYRFIVRAINAVGASLDSEPSAAVVIGAIEAPVSALAIDGTNGRSFITWSAPETSIDDPILGYTVSSFPEVIPPSRCVSTRMLWCRFTGLDNGVTYTFEIRAITASGRGLPVQVVAQPRPEVPRAPASIFSFRTGPTATVRWGAAIDNGSPILSYTVTADQDATKTCSYTVPDDGGPDLRTCEVADLDPSISYTFAVIATNDVGAGARSVSSEVVGVPDAPADLVVTRGPGTVTVAWTPVSGQGSAPSYRAYSTIAPSLNCVTEDTSCTISGLTVGASQTFKVVAFNEAGTSEPSEPSEFVVPALLPSSPSTPLVIAGSRSASVSWNSVWAPWADVTSYTATAMPGDLACTTDAYTCTIEGLVPGVNYTISVAATSELGTGEPSPGVELLGRGPTEAPTGVELSESGSFLLEDHVDVTWTVPDAPGGGPNRWSEVYAVDGEGASTRVCITEIAESLSGSCRVFALQLEPGVSISFRVRTQSGYGYSEFSEPTAVVTPLVTPSAPVGVSAEVAGDVATISWEPVLGNGITSYSVVSPEDDTRTCSVTVDDELSEPSCSIGGLALGTPYTFVVRANNAVATGNASSATNAVTAMLAPEAPTAVGDAVHGNKREIRWTAAVANGAAITSYVAVSVEDPDLTCESSSLIGSPVTHCTINDVDPSLDLSFVVTATNSVGTSAESIASEDYVYVAAPDAPTEVTFSQGKVSWTAPEANGSPITSYVVTATVDPSSPNPVPSWIPLQPGCTYEVPDDGPALNSCTITSGLPSSPIYSWYGPFSFRFSVRAVNAIGTSAASDPTAGVIADLPQRVPSVSATAVDASVTARWSPPANNSVFPINRYDVRLQNGTVLCSVVPTDDVTAPVSCTFPMANYTSTTIRVASFNAFGQSTTQAWTSVTVVPSPFVVSNVSAVAGDSRATVSWTDRMESPDWGTPVYTVTSVEDPTKSCVSEPYFPRAGNWNASCVVTELEPGRPYSFTVTAADYYGNSSVSAATDAVVPFGAPGAPTEVVARFGSQHISNHTGSMIVSWNSAAANSSAVTGYRVRSTTSPERSCTTTATICEIAGLVNGVEHSFIVTATNAAGTGADSEPSNAVLSAAVPSAPTGVRASVNVSTSTPSITVAWDAQSLLIDPVIAGNGSAITEYIVTAVGNPELTCTTVSNSCDIDDVANGSTYAFVVTATNAIGTGPASSPSDEVTPAAAPGAPTGLTLLASDGQVTVGWIAPATNGSAITSYLVADVDDPSLSCSYLVPVSGPSLNSCAVTGLDNGTSYSFRVAASNGIGAGEPSEATPEVLPTAAPGPVRNVAATPAAASVLVEWDAPIDDGGTSIDRVDVTAVQDPSRSCSVEFTAGETADGSCVVTGLANGTAYTFAISAHNAAGSGPVVVSGEFATDRTASLGSVPQSMSMDGTQLWMADSNANSVRAINPGSGALLRVVPLGPAENGDPLTPRGIVSDGTYLWVTNELGYNPSFDAERMSSITQYRASDGSFVRTIYVPWNPNGIASDGRNVWVTGSFHMRRARVWNQAYPDAFQYQFLEYRLAQIDANTGAFIRSVRVGPPALRSDGSGQYWQYPPVDTRSTVSSDGVSVWVANIWDNSVTQLDALTGSVLRTIAVGGAPSSVSSDGTNVWVTNSADATVSQIDAGTGVLVRTIAVGNAPTGVISDGSFVWVANTADDTVTQLAASTGAVVRTIATGDAPTSIAARGTEVWVGNAGSGDLTRIHLGVVPADVPDTPTAVRATYGDARATVTWDAAVPNGSPVLSYEVSTVEDPSRSCSVDMSTTATGSCTVTGLVNGQSYTFTVTATNAVGESTASVASAPVVPATRPDAPIDVTVTRGDREVLVSWTAGSDNGASISFFRVTAVSNSSLSCVAVPVAGEPDGCVVRGLVNGVSYQFTVTATNSVGTSASSANSAAVVPAGVPDAPSGVSVERGDGRVTVTWSTPAANGAPITSYIASVTGDSSATCAVVITLDSTESCDIEGLSNGDPITVDVVAVNDVGAGPAFTSIPVTPAGLPGAPTEVQGTSRPGGVLVEWTPASSNGSPVESYLVTTVGTPLRTCSVQVAVSAIDGCTVEGLTNGVEYAFTVTAVNAVGVGAASLASEPLAPRAPPAAPTSVTAIARNSGAVVTWTAPSANGSPITAFTAWPASDPDNTCSVDVATDASTSCIIDGLENGTNQTFVVSATNAVGESVPSAPSSPVLIAVAPEAPVAVVGVAGDRRVTVRWTPGSDNGSAITEYRVVSVADAVVGCSYLVGDDTGDACVIGGLTNQTSYSFTVVAINALGTSDSSAATVAVAPDVVPDAPASVLAVTGDSSATVTWSAPISNGSAITSYGVSVVGDESRSCVVAANAPLSCIIEGLMNGVAVEFAVTAANDAGSSADALSATVTPSGLPSVPVITSVVVPDGMLYARIAYDRPSANGSEFTAFTAQVVGRPDLTCTNSGPTLDYGVCVVFGLEPGSSNQFIVTATNANGSTSSAATEPILARSVPDAPGSVLASPIMNGTVVSWTTPDDNGSPITALEVTATYGGFVRSCRYVVGVDTGDSCTVTGLRNEIPYDVAVFAINAIGTGEYAVTTVTPMGAPEAPESLRAIPGDGSVSIDWRTPATNGSPITGYVVTVVGDDSRSCLVVFGLGSSLYHSCIIDGLVNGTEYRFRAVALSLIGEGAEAISTPVRPAGAPSAATDVVAVAGPGRAEVSWTAAAANGSPIDSYTAQVVGSPLRSCTYRIGVSTGDACVISGLTNGVSVSFIVIAHNEFGNGPSSVASAPVIPRAPPSVPTGVVAIRSGDRVTITWSASDPQGSPVLSYVAHAVGDDSISCLADQADGELLTCEIADIGSSSDVVVRAINAIGTSEGSAASAAVLSAGVPAAPTSVTAIADDGAAIVSWTAPSSNGSAITGFEVIEVNDSALGCSVIGAAASTCTVTGLVNGQSYSFVLTASNAEGSSAPSAPSAAVVPAGVPGPTMSVVAVPSSRQLEVTWSAANGNGAAVTGYVASVLSDPSKQCSVVLPSALRCTITGVLNDVAQSVQVVASNRVGAGVPSMPSVAVTPSAAPDVPSIDLVTGGVRTPTASIRIRRSLTGSPVTSVEVRAVEDPSLNCSEPLATGSWVFCEITGLEFGRAYTFEARASNAIGDSEWSVPSAPVTAVSTPSAPTDLEIDHTATTATVTWEPASGNGSAVLSSTVEAVTADDSIAATCTASGSSAPSCTLVGLVAGTTYSVRVVSVNLLGRSAAATSSVTPESVPDAPGSVLAVSGDSSVTVRWTAPAANGRPISEYRVVAEGDDTLSCAVDVTVSAATSCTVSGLANGTARRFLVSASNGLGAGPTARTASVTPAAAPAAPTAVVGTKGRSQVTVSWTPGANNGAAIESYTARVVGSPLRSCTTRVALSSSNSCTITGLSNGTAYAFEVLATNSVGTGVASAASAPVTPSSPIGTPDTPLDVSATVGDGSITVRWTAPPANGNWISRYTVTSTTEPAIGCTYRTDTNWGEFCTVSGLTNGTAYRFRVTATNAIGTSDPSSATPAAIPMPPPARVVGATAIAGDRSVTVSWTPADGRGSPITSYVVTESISEAIPFWMRPAPRTCTRSVPPAGTEISSCTVTGLTNGTPARFSVRAVSSAGSGAESSLTTAVTPAGVPDAPTLRTSLWGRSAYNVWNPPADNGSTLTEVQVATVEDPSLSCTRDLTVVFFSACTIDGLTFGTAYTFISRFRNAVGYGAWSAPTDALTPVDAPDPVTAANAAKGFEQLTVSFSAPSANGSPITSYTATAVKRGRYFPSWSTRPWDSRCISVIADGGSTSCVLTGLRNGDTYDVSIVATNAVGSSSPVVVSGVPAAVPSVVTAVPVSADSAITVGWNPPNGNGSAVTSYTVTAVGDVTRTCSYFVGANPWMVETNRCSIAGLTNGTSYAVTVVARNANGESAPAAAVNVVPARIPDVPTSVVAVPGTTSATVSWTTPVSTGGAPISSYTALATRVGDVNSIGARFSWIAPAASCTVDIASAGVNTNTCRVTGLTNGQSYRFSVTATNRAGTSSESALSAAVIPVARPSAPELLVFPADNGSVTAIITINNDEAITSTTAEAIGQPSSSCTVVSGYCTISGLDYGREYRFSAVSTNSAGESAATIAGPITLEAPPAAPTSAVAIPSSTSTSVVFSSPPLGTDEVVASVVGDASKSCAWSSRAGGSRLCVIDGLTSPGSLTYEVTSRSYRLGQSSPRTAVNATAPNAVTVSGFTAGDSPTAASSMSIASDPVLRGIAAMPSIPGTDADVVLNWTPTGTPSWFTGTPGSVAHSITVPVAADGTWSYTLPANFPEGTFSVAASQRTPFGVITNSAAPSLFTIESSPVVPSEVFIRSTGPVSDVVLSGTLPVNRTLTSLVGSVRGGAQAACTAVITGDTWTCTLLGVPTTGSVLFDMAATSQVWSATVCTRYVWGCHWTYPTRAQVSTTTTTRSLAVDATRPTISAPASATFGPSGSIITATEPLLTGFTLAGTASTAASMQSSVVVRAHRGSSVGVIPTATFTAAVAGSGAFSTAIALADGIWTLEVAQRTTTGVSRAGAPITVLVDSAAPVITLGVPAAGGSVPSGFFGGTITGGWGGPEASDPSISAALSLTYFSGAAASGTPVSSVNLLTCATCAGQFSHAPDLAAGQWTVQVTAASRTGVIATATRTFTVDPASSADLAPTVTLLDSDGVELTSAGQVLDTTRCGRSYQPTCDYQLPVAGTHFIGVRVGSNAGRHVGPVATGSVTLYDGATVIGTKSLVDGVAEFATEILVQSSAHQLRATYTGSSWYASGESVTAPFRVKGARPTASIVPVYPDGIANPGSLEVSLTYTGPRGITQHCNYPRVDVYSSYKRTSAGGRWTGGVWIPRPLIENFAQNQGRQRIASGQLLGGTPGAKPTGPGTIAATTASIWGYNESLFTFWVVSAGDDRCAPTNGTDYFNAEQGPRDIFTPVHTDVSMESTAFAGRATVPTTIERDSTLGTASTYSVGVPIPIRIDVCPATASASNQRRDLTDYQMACVTSMWAGLPAASGVPVYRLDAAGNTVGEPVLTDNSGRATVPWTPTEAGWITQRFQVGESAPDGIFRGTRNLSVTVPVEPGPVNLAWTQSPSTFDIGAAATSTLTLGSPNLRGTLAYRDRSPSLRALENPQAAPNTAPAPWSNATISCVLVCRATVDMPSTLRNGSTVLANWLLRDPADTPTLINWWVPKYGGQTTRVLSLDHEFTSAATGLKYTLNTPINRSAPKPLAMELDLVPTILDGDPVLPAGQVPRDRMQKIQLRVANSIPDQWRAVNDEGLAMGTVELTATPNCTGATYCTAAVTTSRFDLAYSNGNPTVVRSNGDARIPELSASMSYSGSDATLEVDAEVFIGGMAFTITATYTPPSNPAVAGWFPVAASSTSMILTGVGPAPITLLQGSATMSGGVCSPIAPSDRISGTCTASGVSPMVPIAEAVDPKPGQTLYIQVQCDLELCTPGDMAIKYDLADTQAGSDPFFFTDPNVLHRYDTDFTHSAGGVWTPTASPRTLRTVESRLECSGPYGCWNRWTGRGQGPFTCEMCEIYPIASLSDTDANANGGLQVGTSLLGLIAYAPDAPATLTSGSPAELAARTGRLVTFPVTVAPLETQSATQVGRSGDTVQVMTAARWPGMAPLVQASPSGVTVDVYLKDSSGTETQIAYCYLDGFCASRRLDGSALPAVDAGTVGGGLTLSISLPGIGWAVRMAGATILVETSSSWGTTASSGYLSLGTGTPARSTSGALGVSASGEWQGAVIGDPDISAPIFGWEFSDGVTSFFSSLFGESAAKVLTMITTELIMMAVETAIMGPFMAQMAVARLATRVASTIAQKAAAAAKAVKATLGFAKTARVVNRGRVAGALIKGATKASEFAYNRLVRSMVEKGVTVPVKYFAELVDSQGPGEIFTSITPVAAPFFQASPALQAAQAETAQAAATDAEIVQMNAYLDSLAAERLTRAARAPEPTPCAGPWGTCGVTHALEDDIGYGYGQSIQFTQFFSTIVQTEVPGYASMTPTQKANSSITVDIMSQRSDQTSRPRYRVLGQLARCTLANTCTSDDAVKVKTINGSMVVAGSFPQWIAWTPPGAWLRVTVSLHDGRTVTTTVDIPFRGDSLPCDDYRILTPVAASTCGAVYDAMRYGADLEWSETYAWGYRMSANGALPWISSDVAAFDGAAAYPNQYGLSGGLPFIGDSPPPS
jgi:titin